MLTTLSFLPEGFIPEEVAGSYSASELLELFFVNGIGGYLLIFVVLALIWGILEIFNLVAKKKNAPSEGKAPSEPTPEPPAVTESETNDEEIVAAIVAAIAAYEQKKPSGFRVVSFRKKS